MLDPQQVDVVDVICPDLLEAIKGLSKSSLVLSDSQYGLAMRTITCAESLIATRRSHLLAKARRSEQPVLNAYASDGWATWLREKNT